MSGPGLDFLRESRRYLTSSYLPRVRSAVERLPRDDLWWRPNEVSNSIGNLLLHMAGNLRQWVIHGVGGRDDIRDRPTEFDARGGAAAEELLQLLAATVEEAASVLDGLGSRDLASPVTIQGMDTTVLGAIYHAVEHFGMHTGQILWIVKARRGEDLGFYHIGQDGTAEERFG